MSAFFNILIYTICIYRTFTCIWYCVNLNKRASD